MAIPTPTYFMVIAACISYSGYECARAATTSLLLNELGSSALPPALIFVAMTSFTLVVFYRRWLKFYSARSALLVSAIGIAGVFLGSAFLLSINPSNSAGKSSALRQTVVFFVFVIRQAYVTFLSSQQLSFIVSLLEKNQDSLGPIYGCSSLASAVAAAFASTLAPVPSLLVAAAALLTSSIVANWAYSTALSDINLSHRIKQQPQLLPPSPPSSSSPPPPKKKPKPHLESFTLPPVFTQNPRLYTLFIVTAVMQMIAALLAMSYSNYLETDLSDAALKTQFVGRFYAIANFTSAVVQFLGLRLLVKYVGLDVLMLVQPLLILVVVAIALVVPNLWTASVAVLLFKTMEYSLFSGVKDLTYLPLSFEARFIAKEYTDVFSYRFGKMCTAVLLTGVGALMSKWSGLGVLEWRFSPWTLLCMSFVLSVLWLYIVVRAQQSARNTIATRIEPKCRL